MAERDRCLPPLAHSNLPPHSWLLSHIEGGEVVRRMTLSLVAREGANVYLDRGIASLTRSMNMK
jgi:hypothetical protein